MNTKTKTRILVLAALLALFASSAPLWAEGKSGAPAVEPPPRLPAWEGKDNANKKQWNEMQNWIVQAWATEQPGIRNMVRALPGQFSKQKDGVKFWKKNKAAYLAALAEAQQAQQAAQQVQQAAAEKARNTVHTVTRADIGVYLVQDGSKVGLTGYKGTAPNIIIPTELEGVPVGWVHLSQSTKSGYIKKPLRSVTIPDGIVVGTFGGLVELESVTLPRDMKEIKPHQFSDCPKLISLTIPGSVTKIGKYAFSGPTKIFSHLDSVSLQTNGCGLKELVIPDTVIEMEASVFEESVIERVVLPKNLKEIPKRMFYNTKNLKSITLPAGLTKIGPDAFSGSGIQSIVIPDSVTVIEEDAFSGCANLQEVTLSRRLQELPRGAFSGCSQLKRLTIPANIKKIDITFDRCSALEEITFEGDVVLTRKEGTLDLHTFFDCNNIKKLNAGPGVTRITNVGAIRLNVTGLSLKEEAESRAAWTAFRRKYE
jgi:uncharacterized protein (UPF0333 family)